MIFHTWHVFISSSLPPPPQGFCRSSRRYFSWNIKPRASSSKPTLIDCSSVTALRAVVYIPSPPLLYSYLYSVLATASLFILAFQTAFLLLPPKSTLDVTRTSCRPCSALDHTPSPFKSTCQVLICQHVKFVLFQNLVKLFPPLFILIVKLCPGLPIHHPCPSVCRAVIQPLYVSFPTHSSCGPHKRLSNTHLYAK